MTPKQTASKTLFALIVVTDAKRDAEGDEVDFQGWITASHEETNLMQIYGPSHLHGPQSVTPPHHGRQRGEMPAVGRASGGDELNISDAGNQAAETARLVDHTRQLPDVRQERVDQIRAQIASGSYETAQKLDVAIERLLDELG